MIFPTTKILKITEKVKGKLFAASISYLFAKIVEAIEEATEWAVLLQHKFYLFDMTLPSNILLWVGIVLSVLIYVLNWVLKGIVKKQKPSENFCKIMKMHTAKEIADLSEKTYSWGYNYCIHYSGDFQGWSPNVFFVSEYDNKEYIFDKRDNPKLPNYCQSSYNQYCEESPKVLAAKKKNDNRERFSAVHIKCNSNRKDPKVDVKLKKTSWVSLLYNWDYFRLLNEKTNKSILPKQNLSEIQNALHDAFEQRGNKFYLNSFCMHLIIETKNGVVLSRISQSKNNDYASTWAATIGEQIEETDFYTPNNDGGIFNNNFVERWAKRALQEEFGIDEQNDYEDVVEPDSLRVLSVDMEADIYNVALTCVIKLKMSLSDFLLDYRRKIDLLENYELKECSLKDIPDILLGYPENQSEYHPSTYLRLLMFHRYKMGTSETQKLFCKESKHKKLERTKD